MLKDKEVVSDGQRQYEIAKAVHAKSHGGINKTTANIAEKYHWVRIKETVSQVIRNCAKCKEHNKLPAAPPPAPSRTSPPPQHPTHLDPSHLRAHLQHQAAIHQAHAHLLPARTPLILPHEHADATRAAAVAAAAGIEIPVDPQMMDGIEHQFTSAPIASMQGMDSQTQQHLAAVAAARAALSEGEGMVTEVDGGAKERHLMETLTAELKRSR